VVRARQSGSCGIGDAATAFVRPEVASLERVADRMPPDHLRFGGTVQSLLFDGANSAVLLNEERSGFEFRVALPQTGRFADLKVGERVHFGFDPQRAICFAGSGTPVHA
jgi:spermidine/putrescine transport system ATP-binding protein